MLKCKLIRPINIMIAIYIYEVTFMVHSDKTQILFIAKYRLFEENTLLVNVSTVKEKSILLKVYTGVYVIMN